MNKTENLVKCDVIKDGKYLLKGEVVPMKNELLEYGFLNLEVREQRVLFYIISKIDRTKIIGKKLKETDSEYIQIELKPIVINLSQMIKDLNLGENYHVIRNALRVITRTPIIIRKPNEREIEIPWFAKTDYDPKNNDGTIIIKMNQEAKQYFLPLRSFTELTLLTLATSIKNKYFSVFYGYLKMHRQYLKNKIEMPMEIIYARCNLDDYYKNNFNRFKTKILEPALKCFSEETCDILVDKYELVKTGKKVTSIIFYTRSNNKLTYKLKKQTEVKQSKPEENIVKLPKKEEKTDIKINISEEEIPYGWGTF